MQPQVITLGESFTSPKALLTCLLFLLLSGCLWSEIGLFWSLLMFVVGTVSVPYTYIISLLNSTLFYLSFWLWKSENVNPHSQVLHPQLFRRCQTSMSPEIQSPIMFLICKTGFSTTDQLNTCQAGRARKDEGLVCINFGFSQSVPDRCNEKKSKNKTKTFVS